MRIPYLRVSKPPPLVKRNGGHVPAEGARPLATRGALHALSHARTPSAWHACKDTQKLAKICKVNAKLSHEHANTVSILQYVTYTVSNTNLTLVARPRMMSNNVNSIAGNNKWYRMLSGRESASKKTQTVNSGQCMQEMRKEQQTLDGESPPPPAGGRRHTSSSVFVWRMKRESSGFVQRVSGYLY